MIREEKAYHILSMLWSGKGSFDQVHYLFDICVFDLQNNMAEYYRVLFMAFYFSVLQLYFYGYMLHIHTHEATRGVTTFYSSMMASDIDPF